MTNDEAIKRITHVKYCYAYEGDYEAFDMAIEALSEDRPTVWIPVSERLPDKEELVLVTDSGSIEFGKLICGLFGNLWLIWLDNCWEEATKVLAWMPLPEPYREDGEA